MARLNSASKAMLRDQFVEVTGAATTVASKWLERHGWVLEESVDGYLRQKGRESGGRAKVDQRIDPRLEDLVKKYLGGESDGVGGVVGDSIGINGTLRYLMDLGIEPEDLESLTLAFFLGLPRVGIIIKSEFTSRWQAAEAFTIPEMKRYVVELHKQIVMDEKRYRELYNYAFGFLMEVPGQRLLNWELAIDYWKLMLLNKPESTAAFKQRLEQWFQFISQEYKRGISRDSWQMFYLFVQEVMSIDPQRLGGYDEMSAWPSVIDEYVEYLKENGLLS